MNIAQGSNRTGRAWAYLFEANGAAIRACELGLRLRTERTRLGMSQVMTAEYGAVHRRTQIRYENGELSPPAEYLQALHGRGFDAVYILLGKRIKKVKS